MRMDSITLESDTPPSGYALLRYMKKMDIRTPVDSELFKEVSIEFFTR